MRTQSHFYLLPSDFLQVVSPKEILQQKPNAVTMGKYLSSLYRDSLFVLELALSFDCGVAST